MSKGKTVEVRFSDEEGLQRAIEILYSEPELDAVTYTSPDSNKIMYVADTALEHFAKHGLDFETYDR